MNFRRASRARQLIVTRMGRDPKGLGGAKWIRATVPALAGRRRLFSFQIAIERAALGEVITTIRDVQEGIKTFDFQREIVREPRLIWIN